MSLDDDFRSAVTAAGRGLLDQDELLPTILVRACIKVLPVAGAGLSVTDALRVPLASSDSHAATAERLQTTLGEGPCLTASNWQEAIEVDLPGMAAHWPTYTEKLVAHTPYRAVASLPLLFADRPAKYRIGALDLYLTDSTSQLPPLQLLADEIAEPIAEMLFRSPPLTERHGTALPVWMDSEPVTRRMNVWVAVGMMLADTGCTNTDALAALRGYASTRDTNLDDIAEAMVNHQLTPATVAGETAPP